jgi:TPR repeat protein
MLSKDGDATRCSEATDKDRKPPLGCGALLRMQVADIVKCEGGQRWVAADGCVWPDAAPRASGGPTESAPVAEEPVRQANRSRTLGGGTSLGGGCQPGDATDCEARCGDGDARSCLTLGFMLSTGRGVAEDKRRAATLYSRACDGAQADACNNLASMLMAGDGIAVNTPKANALRARACDLGNDHACELLGRRATSSDTDRRDRSRDNRAEQDRQREQEQERQRERERQKRESDELLHKNKYRY